MPLGGWPLGGLRVGLSLELGSMSLGDWPLGGLRVGLSLELGSMSLGDWPLGGLRVGLSLELGSMPLGGWPLGGLGIGLNLACDGTSTLAGRCPLAVDMATQESQSLTPSSSVRIAICCRWNLNLGKKRVD